MISITDVGHCQRLAESLWEQAVKGENTGVTLRYGGSTFSAHLCVLQSYPVFFKDIEMQVESEFPLIDADVFQTILKFLYTGNCSFPEESLLEVEAFAWKYKLGNLSDLCVDRRQKEHEDTEDVPVEEAVTIVVESQLTDQEAPLKKRKTTGAKGLKCLECKEVFSRTSELSKHYAEHASKKAVNFCKTCGIKFTEDVTEQSHTCYQEKTKSIRCAYCLQHCGNSKILRKHENEHKCGKCNKVFDTIEFQNDHQCQGIASEKVVFECTNCGKSYTSKQCFINHLKVHNGMNYLCCKFCEKTFLHYLPFKKHMIAHSEGTREQYECEVCGEKFKLKIKYYAHCIKLSHSLHEVPHKCKVCKRLFSNERDLNSHCRVHYAEKPFKCGECEKTYSSKLGLKLHIDSIHLKQLRYECGECKKRFAQPSHLSQHKRIHAAEKDFVCSFCGLELSTKAGLQRHERRHSGFRNFCSTKSLKKTTHVLETT